MKIKILLNFHGKYSKNVFHEIDLFDFTTFVGLDFFKFSGSLWNFTKKKKNFVKSKYHFIGGGRNIMNIMHASTFNVTKKESSPIPLSASGLNFPTKTEPEAYKPPQQSIDRAMEMKREILSKVERLGKILPPNTLDQLIGKNKMSFFQIFAKNEFF